MIERTTEKEIIRLYRNGEKAKDILSKTGIKSVSTIYTVLRRNNIPIRPAKDVKRVAISLDKDTVKIIERENPANLSDWICRKIKESY